jgi:7-cyano-7-deazaguanine synthase
MGLAEPLAIETPLAGLTKAQVVRRAAGLPLELTFSCLSPTFDYRHCGACNKCAERLRGFAAAGMEDPAARSPSPSSRA